MDRFPVRCTALACVISGGMLISGPGLVASADDGNSGGTSSPGATDTSSKPHGFLSSLPGLHWPSQSPGVNAPTIGSIVPPHMNLPTLPVPGTTPNGPSLVRAFMLPDPGNTHWVGVTVPGLAPQTRGGQQLAIAPQVDSHLANIGIAPQSQSRQRGENASPTISLVPLAPSGVPAGPPITINNSVDVTKPLLPQELPPPLVFLVAVIAKGVQMAGQVITALVNVVVGYAANVINALLSENVVPSASSATMPAVLSVANPVLSPSGPPPADVAAMGMDVPEAPGPPSPIGEPPQPQTSPADGSSALSDPVAFRAGYSDYLRNAGMAEITAIAVPGALAILLFSLGGGFIGYRQARAGHIIRAEGITRFLR